MNFPPCGPNSPAHTRNQRSEPNLKTFQYRIFSSSGPPQSNERLTGEVVWFSNKWCGIRLRALISSRAEPQTRMEILHANFRKRTRRWQRMIQPFPGEALHSEHALEIPPISESGRLALLSCFPSACCPIAAHKAEDESRQNFGNVQRSYAAR